MAIRALPMPVAAFALLRPAPS